MSRFLGKAAAALAPYVPGEQPQDMQYIKLNTNENPYPPSPSVQALLREYSAVRLRLYPDPECAVLRDAMAHAHGLEPEQVFVGGGSDEVLGFAFMAFFDKGDRVYFPDITYGFYSVYAQLCGLEAVCVPLCEDFTVAPEDYSQKDGHIVIANPNAPTGIALTPAQVEEILQSNPDKLVILDEAYVDFSAGKTCVPLLKRYRNLLVVQTYSKSRALAGMRIGCALGDRALIADLNRIKYAFNPYNLDHISLAVGVASTKDHIYLRETTDKIVKTREKTRKILTGLDFAVLPSEANFLFARHTARRGKDLYLALKQRGILVRHFAQERISDFVRITVGTDADMEILRQTLEELGGTK